MGTAGAGTGGGAGATGTGAFAGMFFLRDARFFLPKSFLVTPLTALVTFPKSFFTVATIELILFSLARKVILHRLIKGIHFRLGNFSLFDLWSNRGFSATTEGLHKSY